MAGFGSNPSGGYNDATKSYKADPSLENYLKLRRENPNDEIEIAVLGGIDPVFYIEPELREHGIEPELVLGAMDADPSAISELALLLMEKLVEAKKLASRGETQLGRRKLRIPEKLVDWIINVSLEGLSWNDRLEIPRDLIVLIRERLGGATPEYAKGAKAHFGKRSAALVAGQLKAQGVTPTYKMLGEIFEVAPSTVMRWFASGELESKADFWSRKFCETEPLAASPARKKALRKKKTAQRKSHR